jgi:ATP-dependent metalloprotease FtsH
MDDKTSRQNQLKKQGRHSVDSKRFAREVYKVIQTHRRMCLTGILGIVLMLLVFGIVAQIPVPTASNAPANVTTIDYTTFIKQVRAGNVEAVVIQGNTVNGLLATPLSSKGIVNHQGIVPSSLSEKKILASTDYTSWLHSIGIDNSGLLGDTDTTQVASNRTIFTQIPAGGDSSLAQILTDEHVMIRSVAVAPSIDWQRWLLLLLPLLLLLIFIVGYVLRRKNPYSASAIDEQMNKMGKNRTRRFERSKEGVTLSSQKKSQVPTSSSWGTPVKPASSRVSIIPPVTFDDVAGIDEVRAELVEIVQFLRTPEQFNRLGARIPRGVLLVGQPGTGKTLLAKAVAGEAHVPFFSISASEFVEMFVGVGASRVRDLFKQARQAAPCVVFIDEIDAVGRKRSIRASGNDERDQTLNQLLVELDGFDERQAVIVLAATNRVDILDQALLRPGRFDRRITVSPPDRVGREAILRVHTRQTPLHDDVYLERLARLTTGMTGADLANLVNEAALSAARHNRENVDHECFEEALARIQLGALRPLVMSEEERNIIAVHEAGHALVAHHLPEADRVNRVTILPRGQSLGVTQFTAEADRYNYSRDALMTRIAVGLGGRMAEELTFGKNRITTGAENDLQVVTNLARRMVTRWGMSERLGTIFVDNQDDENYALNMRRVDAAQLPAQARTLVVDKYGNMQMDGSLPIQCNLAMAISAPQSTHGVAMNTLIDAEVQCILNEGREIARNLLTKYVDQLELLADALMKHEQLDRAQFEALFVE